MGQPAMRQPPMRWARPARPAGAARLELVGVPVDPVTMAQTLDWIEGCVQARTPAAHLCVNAANTVRAHRDRDYADLLHRADVVGSDGASMLAAARVLGAHVPERVTGIDLMTRACARAAERGWGVYLLGARADVVARVADDLRRTGVRVVGSRDGYLDGVDRPALAADIAAAGTDVLFVGMPSPAKERFVVDCARPAGVPVSIGVGGSFDVLAGDLRRAPLGWQRLGLEWLYRVLQEPRRLAWRYAETNTAFVLLVLADRARRLGRRPRVRREPPR